MWSHREVDCISAEWIEPAGFFVFGRIRKETMITSKRLKLSLSAIAAVLLGGILSLPVESFASVTDVILTGLPPNTTISLTNEETKEKVERSEEHTSELQSQSNL